MLFNRSGIGLDIGSKKIKLARAKKAGMGLELAELASMPTPEGLLEQGRIAAPEELGKAISPLVNKLGWKGKKVISALSCQEVFCANYILPRMNREESREAAMFQSSPSLPFSLEETACDIHFLGENDNNGNRKREVFFIAAERLQVEYLKQVCTLAGLRLRAVEIPALALNRLWHNHELKGLEAYLDIGFSYANLAIFKQRNLLFQKRFASFLAEIGANLGGDLLLGKMDIKENPQIRDSVEDFSGRLRQMLASFQRQQREIPIEQLYLWGGGAKLRGLAKYLAAVLNTATATLTTPGYLHLSPRAEEYRSELCSDFPAAIGLASRGLWG